MVRSFSAPHFREFPPQGSPARDSHSAASPISDLGSLQKMSNRVAQRETPLEKNLREATSNQNWDVPNSQLNDIAWASFDFQESSVDNNSYSGYGGGGSGNYGDAPNWTVVASMAVAAAPRGISSMTEIVAAAELMACCVGTALRFRGWVECKLWVLHKTLEGAIRGMGIHPNPQPFDYPPYYDEPWWCPPEWSLACRWYIELAFFQDQGAYTGMMVDLRPTLRQFAEEPAAAEASSTFQPVDTCQVKVYSMADPAPISDVEAIFELKTWHQLMRN
eukprot:s1767_g4.t1